MQKTTEQINRDLLRPLFGTSPRFVAWATLLAAFAVAAFAAYGY